MPRGILLWSCKKGCYWIKSCCYWTWVTFRGWSIWQGLNLYNFLQKMHHLKEILNDKLIPRHSQIMLNQCSSKAALEGCLTLLRLRLAWIPLSLIFTVICRSDKSGLRKGGFTLTACFFLGSTMYLINCSTVIMKINNNLRTRHRDKKIFLLPQYDLRMCQNLVKQTPFISMAVIIKKQ